MMRGLLHPCMEDKPTEKEVTMKKKSKSLASFTRTVLPLLLCVLFLIPTAYADIGPKPEVTITVVNAPEGELYLDLLAEGKPTNSPYPNSVDECDPIIVNNLRSLEADGWVLAYTTGLSNKAPVFGDLCSREDGTWRYSYIGLPDTFRVAAATADQAQAVETAYTRDYFSNIVYDWQTNTVREATPRPLRFLARLASTLVPTLIIEGLIFWLFGFREKRSWIVFLIVNAVTQLGLHLLFSMPVVLAGEHPLYYAVVFIPAELVICLVESIAYNLLLKEYDRHQRIGYAVLANITSAVLGYFPLHLLYDFLKAL